MSYWNILLVDSSASMSSNKNSVNKGIVDLFIDQKDNTDRFTFLTFDTDVNLIVDSKFNEIMPEDIINAIKNVGLTALYDAIGYVYEMVMQVNSINSENILLTIITDGYENSSKKYTLKSLKNLREIVDKNYNFNVTFICEDKLVLDSNCDIISHANESCEVGGDYSKAFRTVSRTMSSVRHPSENPQYSIEKNERNSSEVPLLSRQISISEKKRPRLF
jgi:Mg-chelatase subunit ChlD